MSDNPLLTAPLEETVYLYSGADQKRLEEFDQQIDAALVEERDAEVDSTRRMSTKRPPRRSKELAAEADTFREEAKSRAVVVKMRGINFKKRGEMLDEHPPRDGNNRDAALGYNGDTFPVALVHGCIVEPEVSFEQVQEFAQESSAARFDRLFEAANIVSRTDADLPKSSAVSVLDMILGQQ